MKIFRRDPLFNSAVLALPITAPTVQRDDLHGIITLDQGLNGKGAYGKE